MSGTCESCGVDASYLIHHHKGNVSSLCESCASRLDAELQDAMLRLAEMKIEVILLTRFVDTWRRSRWAVAR